MTSHYDTYTSPLAARNASPEMLRIWSPRHKFQTWRRIWLAVAEAQHSMGLPVTKEQVEELRANLDVTDEDMKAAEQYERKLRHDVMAHVHAWGDRCPNAKGIIHLGMTSEDVGSNADQLLIDEALELTTLKLVRLVSTLASRASETIHIPALAFTHYQPAQPTTVGRRAALWAGELCLILKRFFGHSLTFKLRGFKGATGTQASYLALLGGDAPAVDLLEGRVVQYLCPERSGDDVLSDDADLAEYQRAAVDHLRNRKPFPMSCETEAQWQEMVAKQNEANQRESSAIAAMTVAQYRDSQTKDNLKYLTLPLSGQTYPRVLDTFVLADLASVASVLHKIATDIRLLSNRKEIDEPFEDKQIGSSAMPYKRNPMRCERICGLSRFVMNLVGNAYDTAATQWLERTLDDSSNRRLTLPEAFLALDGALDLMHNVAKGLIVHEAMVRKNLMAELPFMATENLLMACVKAGGDRQEYHELIRQHAQAAGLRVKQEGLDNDLLDRLKADPAFHAPKLKNELDWDGLMDPMKYIGRSVEQTERFIGEVVEPLRAQYADEIAKLSESAPKV